MHVNLSSLLFDIENRILQCPPESWTTHALNFSSKVLHEVVEVEDQDGAGMPLADIARRLTS